MPPQPRAVVTREKLIRVASDLIRQKGFVATRIEDICEIADVTKGAFFHHFSTKEDLAEGCLIAWRQAVSRALDTASFQQAAHPRERALGLMDFFIQTFEDPDTVKSCLVGTTVQETSETHPQLRMRANECLQLMREIFKGLLDQACCDEDRTVDTGSLADLWIATLQGSLIVYKASRDPEVIGQSLRHVRQYIAGYLPAEQERQSERTATGGQPCR